MYHSAFRPHFTADRGEHNQFSISVPFQKAIFQSDVFLYGGENAQDECKCCTVTCVSDECEVRKVEGDASCRH